MRIEESALVLGTRGLYLLAAGMGLLFAREPLQLIAFVCFWLAGLFGLFAGIAGSRTWLLVPGTLATLFTALFYLSSQIP